VAKICLVNSVDAVRNITLVGCRASFARWVTAGTLQQVSVLQHLDCSAKTRSFEKLVGPCGCQRSCLYGQTATNSRSHLVLKSAESAEASLNLQKVGVYLTQVRARSYMPRHRIALPVAVVQALPD
jgi:hypothetical protein